jgi:hypothetical protein
MSPENGSRADQSERCINSCSARSQSCSCDPEGRSPLISLRASIPSALLDESRLNGIRLLGGAKSLNGNHFRLAHRAHRHYARSYDFAAHDDRARRCVIPQPNLGLSSAVVSENEQKKCLRVDVHGMILAVHFQRDLLHDCPWIPGC